MRALLGAAERPAQERVDTLRALLAEVVDDMQSTTDQGERERLATVGVQVAGALASAITLREVVELRADTHLLTAQVLARLEAVL
jgi:hypothetical protein